MPVRLQELIEKTAWPPGYSVEPQYITDNIQVFHNGRFVGSITREEIDDNLFERRLAELTRPPPAA